MGHDADVYDHKDGNDGAAKTGGKAGATARTGSLVKGSAESGNEAVAGAGPEAENTENAECSFFLGELPPPKRI